MHDIFYVTTPIFYVNDEPHLGHAYAAILADVFARYARLRGKDTFFLTGVDEHGQKVYNAVHKNQIEDPQAYVDQMAARFQSTWKRLRISNDDFIRTTEARHRHVVQTVLQELWDRGEIYRGEYEGWYCVPDERFWTEKDIIDGACPDCGRPVERIVEANYFFRMSFYQDWLVNYIHQHPGFIQPESRRNEVLGFLRQPLNDLCISRPAARLPWGIRLPFAPEYVTYVWFDALLNYVTAAGYLQEEERFNAGRFEDLWPNALHLIGKDILTTHSVYWLTMLKAMNLPLPKNIFATGWWIVNGTKMGKSLGNAVKPLDLANCYGIDAFRYFLMREMTLGQDAEFDEERLTSRYTVDLANTLGNLLHRVVSMTGRYCEGRLPVPAGGDDYSNDGESQKLRVFVEALPEKVFERIDAFAVQDGLSQIMDVLSAANGYLERTAPWKEAKAGNQARVETILYYAAETLRLCAVLLTPVMPERMTVLFDRLGWQPPENLRDSLRWGVLKPGSLVNPGDPLFPRIDSIER